MGKTCLLMRMANESFSEQYNATIGLDFKYINYEKNNKKFKMQIWDTAGEERFRCITPSYYRNTHVYLCLFDLSYTINLLFHL